MQSGDRRPALSPYFPLGQLVHTDDTEAPIVDENFPAGHAAQDVVPVVSANIPGAQFAQLVAPEKEYLPRSQLAHGSPPPVVENCPAVHPLPFGKHSIDPASEVKPVAHDSHAEDNDAPKTAEYLPAVHCKQDDAPANEYCPASQSRVHKSVRRPGVSPYFPAGHSAHAVELEEVANLPCVHEVQITAPA